MGPDKHHLVSLIDGISTRSASVPPLSQIDDMRPDEFCNGDDKPDDCGYYCICTHKIDIPLNAVVEIILVDEGESIRSELISSYWDNNFQLPETIAFRYSDII